MRAAALKPSAARVLSFLSARRERDTFGADIARELVMVDYRTRIAEINKEFQRRGSLSRVASRKVRGHATNAYRLVMFDDGR